MKRRIVKGCWVFLLAVALFFSAGDTFGTGDGITQLSKSYLYSIPRWEVGNFLKKWTAGLDRVLSADVSQEEKTANVRRYFELSAEINELTGRVNRADFGLTAEPELETLRERLEAFMKQREDLEPQVEETLEAAVTSVLKDQGVSSSFIGFDLLWPPVDFRLDDVPKVLVVSRRDRIGTLRDTLLRPDISTAEREALEEAVAKRDLSALVVSIGGVATYPSLIREGRSLRSTLRTAAHEWTHHYLTFHPLGRGYFDNGNMTTLNETVADVVGDEIGDLVWRRYFATPDEIADAEAREAANDQESGEPQFDFNTFMRDTRVRADQLLGQGLVDDAEAYMEERRVELADHGIFIRKINQAFFAFNGSYAIRSGTGSVSPIGDQATSVRERSESIGDILRRVNRFASYESFLRDEVD